MTEKRIPSFLRLLVGGVSLAVSQGCATGMRRPPSPIDSVTATIRLNGIVEDHWRFLQASRPDVAVRANSAVMFLPDPSLERVKVDAQFARAAMAALDEVYVEALREDDYISWLSLRWEMEAMAGWPAFYWTRLSDLAPGSSALDRAMTVLKLQSLRYAADGARFTGMLTRVADLVRTLREEFSERAERGVRLPAPVAERTISYLRSLIGPAEGSPFGLSSDFVVPTDTGWQERLKRSVDSIITRRLNPQLDSLVTFLERERGRGSDLLGLRHVPGGPAYYATILRYRTTIDVTPEEAHAIGLREVARLAALAAEARRQAGLPVDRDSLREAFRRDSAFSFDERGSVPERTAQRFEAESGQMEALFGGAAVPAVSIGVFTRVGLPIAIYEMPSFTRTIASYFLNLDELLSRSAFVLPALVAGDLMPGLHLQRSAQLFNEQLPTFRRLAFHDGFVRGWQAYALQAADSLSINRPAWERFSLRLRELAFACGLVVDTGINALGWSRSDALGFLRAYLPNDDDDLEREFVLRASAVPGELSAATLGARELRGLRLWAMRELGDRFSLPAFHAEVLRVGSVPLPVLGSHLERWIWEQTQPLPPPAARR
ncbi:MAG TPA: DUF885 domain-containing protein [Gemmatimonadaceae bacterium]